MTPFESTWQSLLPEDEIARQQAVKEQLKPGLTVNLCLAETPLGEFIYSGIWDTMHTFYPTDAISNPDLHTVMTGPKARYLRRDLRGRVYVQLPYTILADTITSITHNLPQNDL